MIAVMSAVNSRSRRRRAALAILPLLLAACSGDVPTASPVASVASPTPAASPTGPSGPSPDPNCPALDATYVGPEVEVTPKIGRIGLQLQITKLVPAWDPTASFTPPPNDRQSTSGILPGGHDAPTDLWFFYPDLVPLGTPVILSVRPAISIGGGPSQPLGLSVIETRGTYWSLNVRGIPDTDGPARLDVVVEWRDACFTYTAEGTVNVTLVSTLVTSTCPLDPEGFYQQINDVEFAPPLLVGGGEVDLIGVLPVARFLPEGPPGGDGPTPFQLWDRTLPSVTGAPDTTLTVSEANSRVELMTMSASFYARGQVIRHLDQGKPASPTRVLLREPNRRTDGTFRLRLPADTGRYVVWLSFAFESTCASGTAWSVFTVDVAVPEASPSPPPSEEPSPTP
jgi:hypothetical protein